jgi:uncharacterized protein
MLDIIYYMMGQIFEFSTLVIDFFMIKLSRIINIQSSPFFMHNQYHQQCKVFVSQLCSKRPDKAHSVEHVEAVNNISLDILKHDFAGYGGIFWSTTVLSAWLHDVKDHKYEEEEETNELMLDKFLVDLELEKVFGKDLKSYICKIIENVSFSKENKAILEGNPINFEKVISDENFPNAHLVRHIVSDADKIEALGKEGLERCLSTATGMYLKKNQGKMPTKETLKKMVNDHAKEKLLRLKDEFIVTNHGKLLAQKAHDDFVNALEEFNRD